MLAPGLAIAAALLSGLQGPPGSGPDQILWVALCDALHPGRSVPLPIRRDRDGAPATACHAAGAAIPERRRTLRR